MNLRIFTVIFSMFVSSFAFGTECYDYGKEYKSKWKLSKSKDRVFGFKKDCHNKLETQKKNAREHANFHRNALGLKISKYLSSDEQRELSVWQKLEQIRSSDEDEKSVAFPDIEWWSPYREVHRRALMKHGQRKFWNFNVGTADSFAAEVKPFVGFFGSRLEAAGEAGVELHGNLMGMWEGKLGMARAVAFSPGTGPLSIDLQIVGPEGSMLWDKNLFSALQIKLKKDFQQRIAHDTTWRFALGPVPMATEVGAVGTIGLKNSLALYPLQVSAWGKPWVAAETYVMSGADIWIVGTGVGGQLRLASDEFTLSGRSFVEYNEEPTIRLESDIDNKITLLSGDIFAFIYLKLPFVDRWMRRFTIFEWGGIEFDKKLAEHAFVIKKDQTLVFGDLERGLLLGIEKLADKIDQVRSRIIDMRPKNQKSYVVQQNQRLAKLLR